MKKIFAILACIACCTAGKAQIYELSLEESIEIAKTQSLSMQSLMKDLDMAEYNLKATTARLRTNITLNLTAPDYSKTISTFEDTTGIWFYQQDMLRTSGSLVINQPLPTDGNIYIQANVRSFNDYFMDQRSSDLNTRIGFTQPIDAFYGYNNIRSALKTAKLQYEQTQKSLKRAELTLVYTVSASYYGLLSLQKSKEFALMDLDRQSEAYEMSKKKFAAGLIREVEALQMEVDLADAQNTYDIAVLDQIASTNQFKELIGLELSDSVTLKNELIYEEVDVDSEAAVQYALENRLEIREMEIRLEMQKMSLKQQKARGLPSIDLNAYYERVGVDRQALENGLGNSMSDTWMDFQRRPSNFGIGLNISIPIFDWGQNKALVRSAKARLEQLEINKEGDERSIETEVRNLVSNLHSNLIRLRLLEKNIEVAEKSFAITLDRFSDGDIGSQDLALERNRLNSAYNSHLTAYTAYQLSLADLTRKTFYDFRNNCPVE